MNNGEREFLKEHFLQYHGYSKSQREKLDRDASFRTYERLYISPNETKILMDCPPGKENLQLFVKVGNWLRSQGFSAPEIFKFDPRLGLAIIEDFGRDKFSTILCGESDLSEELDPEYLYNKAVDVLVKINSIIPQEGLFPYYDDEIYIREVMKFTKWYVPTLNGKILEDYQIENFRIIWKQHLLPLTRLIPATVVLRDYHVENLLWLGRQDSRGIENVGIIDFQDALLGSTAYDLVSLLEDARIDVPQELAHKMITKYLTARPEINRKEFLAAYAVLGVQRNLKIIGIFTKKAVKDKDSRYLQYLPRIWRYLEASLKHPLLVPMRKWLDEVIPANMRASASNNFTKEKLPGTAAR